MALGIVSRSFHRGKPHLATTIDGFSIGGNVIKTATTTWYVDSVKGTAGASGSADSPFPTLTLAVAAASAWDTIYVAMGDYTEEDIAITQRGLKIIGANGSGSILGGALLIGSAAHILRIRADDVEIAGLAFYQTGAFACITAGPSALNTWRPYIHDCMFSGPTNGASGIRVTDDIGSDAPYALIENCKFYDMYGNGIYLRASVATVRNCHFELKAAAGVVGVEDDVNGASKPFRSIVDCKFVATDKNSVGIKVNQTPSSGQLLIQGNHFVGAFTAQVNACDVVTSGKTGLMGLNYFNATVMSIS